MIKLPHLWKFLTNEINRKTLVFVGAALVTLVSASWQAYLHFSKSSSTKSNSDQSVNITGISGIAVAGDFSARDINIGISLAEYEKGLKEKELSIREELSKVTDDDENKRKVLEKQLVSTEKKLGNVQSAYQQEKQSLEETAELLVELRETVNSKSLSTALDSLNKGDTKDAEQLLKQVLSEEKNKQAASLAAKQLNSLAVAREDTDTAKYYSERAKTIENKPAVHFFDDFNDKKLAKHWQVLNPNKDDFFIDNSALNVIISKEAALVGNEKFENIFQLNNILPNGNWTTTVRMIPKIQTFREVFMLAIYKNKDNMFLSSAYPWVECCESDAVLSVSGSKIIEGKATNFSMEAIRSPSLGEFYSGTESVENFVNWTTKNIQAFYLRIKKKGRIYTVHIKIQGEATSISEKEEKWVKVQALTLNRQMGSNLALAFRQQHFNSGYSQVRNGEGTIMVDWIKVESGAE